MRYPHILSVEACIKDDMERIINLHIPTECESKCLGNGMWQIIFYSTEDEYDKIAEDIEKENSAD